VKVCIVYPPEYDTVPPVANAIGVVVAFFKYALAEEE
jgi:hypothetical protein